MPRLRTTALAWCALAVSACAGDSSGAPDANDGGADTVGDIGPDAAAGADVADDSGDLDAPAPAPSLVAMTFNIRADDSPGAEFSPAESWDWVADDLDDRRDRVVARIDEAAPDLLCLQESRPEPVAWLLENLAGDFVHHGAERGGQNAPTDMNGILFRADRFSQVDGGHFWLSDTPDVPGSTFPASDDDNARMASWVLLDDQVTGQERFVLCTHWSLDGDARVRAAQLIRTQLVALGAPGAPTLVMGDLNATEDAREFRILSGREDVEGDLYEDAYRAVHVDRSEDEASFHAFTGRVAGSRIDVVLVSDDLRATDAVIDRTRTDGGYPSDHYPVVVTLVDAP